jgi:hypothetical protein
MKKNFLIFFSLFAFITGCPAQTIDKGISLTGHKTFEVTPVLNETGKTFDFDVAAELTRHIKSSLLEKGFSVTDTLDNAIIIKSSLVSYETGITRAYCTVKSKLIDKMTQKVLSEIVTTRRIFIGGLSLIGMDIDQAILDEVANDIVFEVERRINNK